MLGLICLVSYIICEMLIFTSQVPVSTQQGSSSESAIIGNQQIVPIPYINTTNISNENTKCKKNNDSTFGIWMKEHSQVNSDTQTILKDFASVINETFYQNLDRFWTVFNNYVEAVPYKDEQLVRIDNLFVLLNVFTSLYKAIQLNIPIEGMIHDIVKVLQIADIKNTDSNRDGFQIQPTQNSNTTQNEEPLRQYLQNLSKAYLDSKGVSISENDGRKVIDDADNVNVWVKFPPSSSGSNKPIQTKVKGIDKPVIIQSSLLINPNYLEKIKGKPDGYNVLTGIVLPKQKEVARENDVYEDTKFNYDVPDTAEASKLPYRIEDTKINYLPEVKESNNLSWYIENKAKPYTIEKKIVNVPVQLYPSDDSELTISDDKIVLDSNQTPLTSTINGIAVKNKYGKPYLYTYVINPAKFLYRPPDISSNIIKMNSGKYNKIYDTGLESGYDISNTYDRKPDSKIVYINAPSSDRYESGHSLSEEPRLVYSSEPGYYGAQWKIKKDIELSDNYTDNNNLYLSAKKLVPKLTVEYNKETLNNPGLLFSNAPYDSKYKVELEKDYGVPIIQDIGAEYKIPRPNIPSTPYESKLKGEISAPLIDDTEFYINKVKFSKPLNYYESKLKFDKQTDNSPILRPNIPSYEYIHKEKEYRLPTSTYGGERAINPDIKPETSEQNAPLLKESFNTYIQGNRPTYDYVDPLKATITPSYQLFATENLLKLQDAIKRKQLNPINASQYRALTKLKNINIILLKLAEYLGENEMRNIFYNVQSPQYPLQVYVHNLLQQKWLQNIMLLLYNNNFNFNILNDPRLYSYLKVWRFPINILKFLEATEVSHGTTKTPSDIEKTFNSENVVHHNIDFLDEESETQDDLDNFEPETVVNDLKKHNEGIILSVSGFKARLDANTIIEILKKYLVHQNYVKAQEQTITRGNKIEMFKKIAFFLNEKGYGRRTIIDLIRKLYRAMYTIEVSACSRTQNNDYVQNAYDAILPVLRRSGQ